MNESCILCCRSDGSELTDIELNSLKFGDEIVDYSDLLLDLLNIKVRFSCFDSIDNH